MLKRSICLALAGVASACAASISTSTACWVGGSAEAQDPHACALQRVFDHGNPYADATSAASFSLPGSADDPFRVTVNTGADARGGNSGTDWVTAVASASASITDLTLTTDGTPRRGYLVVSDVLTWSHSAGNGWTSAMFSIGSLTWNCAYGSGSGWWDGSGCEAPWGDGWRYVGPESYLVPITLGVAFPFRFTQTNVVTGDIISGQSLQPYGQTDLSLQFFEADGVTPVAVFAASATTPEPATWTGLPFSSR